MSSETVDVGQRLPDARHAEETAGASVPSVELALVVQRSDGFYCRYGKPVADRLAALSLLLVLLPVLVVVAGLVLVSAGRPIFFTQVRVGRDGAPFRIVKFRTMKPDRRRERAPIEHADRRNYHKSDKDPRHFPLGQVLRRYSLDELPQLINVLKGEMSLVGPRPELPQIVDKYLPWQHQRHLVRPGLTGPWQIGARGDGPMHEFAHLDLAYVRDLSLRRDLALCLRTVPALLRRKGR